jgi:uncharacterized protein
VVRHDGPVTNARVVQLWRFPVKSFQGEQVEDLELGPAGVVGDRRWGLVDVATGKLMSAKRYSALFEASARTRADGSVHVVLPTGDAFVAGDPDGSAQVSAWLGREVELRAVDAATRLAYEMTFDPPDDSAEMVEIPAPAGSFLDLAAVHLLSTATLARAEAAEPELDWDVRRFRPNVVVELAEGADPAVGFTEDQWVGHELAVGGAVVSVRSSTVRCAMPLRAQPGLEAQPEMYAAMESLHANHVGIYCEAVATGAIRVGDPVSVR